MKQLAKWVDVEVSLNEILKTKPDQKTGRRIIAIVPDGCKEIVAHCEIKLLTGSLVITSDTLDLFTGQIVNSSRRVLYPGRLTPRSSVIEQHDVSKAQKNGGEALRVLGYKLMG